MVYVFPSSIVQTSERFVTALRMTGEATVIKAAVELVDGLCGRIEPVDVVGVVTDMDGMFTRVANVLERTTQLLALPC